MGSPPGNAHQTDGSHGAAGPARPPGKRSGHGTAHGHPGNGGKREKRHQKNTPGRLEFHRTFRENYSSEPGFIFVFIFIILYINLYYIYI